jgi:hypothetical protein
MHLPDGTVVSIIVRALCRGRRNRMKTSTIETLKQYEDVLRVFAKKIADKHNIDRDEDDWWTAYPLDEDSFADINVYVFDDDTRSVLKIAAYPVDADGFTICDEWLMLYESSTKKKTTSKFSIRKFRK